MKYQEGKNKTSCKMMIFYHSKNLPKLSFLNKYSTVISKIVSLSSQFPPKYRLSQNCQKNVEDQLDPAAETR